MGSDTNIKIGVTNMSYNVPAVNVYQELVNSGGPASITPDLEACIIGPAYQVLTYDPTSAATLAATAATSATTALASITAGSYTLTFASLPPFTSGALIIAGAGNSGANLSANIISVVGNVITLDTAASTSVTSAVVSAQGSLTNNTITNTFTLPSQLVGQVVNPSSVQVFANNALVQTISTTFTGYPGSNVLNFATPTGTCSATALSANVTVVSDVSKLGIGDYVSVSGAGVSGAALLANIINIVGSTVTLSVAAATTNASATITKPLIDNIGNNTNTLLVEDGDATALYYNDTIAGYKYFNSSAMNVSIVSGNLTSITIADVLPTTVSPTTTSTALIASGASGFTLTSPTGFAVGDTILIKGAGIGGVDLETVIGGLAGSVVTGLTPVTSTATAGPATIIKRATLLYQSRKLYNNQLLPITKPLSGGSNYSTANVATLGTLAIQPLPEVVYGVVQSAQIYIAYNALRTDLGGQILTIEGETDCLGQFGVISPANPLALGVSIALANTTTRIRAIAVTSNDSIGYQAAFDLAQAERLYAIVPLTQQLSILESAQLHVDQMSTPQMASWRTALVNTAIATTAPIGQYTSSLVNANSGNNTITLVTGNYILTASNATFISDGVAPGDTINVTAGTGTPSPVGTLTVQSIISNQQVIVNAAGTATGVSYFVTRLLSKTQRAANVAASSAVFGNNRVVHIQPDTVVVNLGSGNVVQPGYFLCCAVAGLIAGMPSQQGFTNMAVAGISDLSNSNFVFTRAQLDTMAGSGTFLFVQDTAGGLPYVRHELTTDMSVYYYREMMAVRDWDYISYYFHDVLKPFIGRWNITPDTLSIIRQVINAGISTLSNAKLPKIGAPLISGKIVSLAQDPINVDQLNVNLSIQIPATLNYLNLYLTI